MYIHGWLDDWREIRISCRLARSCKQLVNPCASMGLCFLWRYTRGRESAGQLADSVQLSGTMGIVCSLLGNLALH